VPQQTIVLLQTGGQIDGRQTFPAHGVLDVGQHRRNRPLRHRRVAEQIGAAGNAFLGLKVDQQQRRRAHGLRAGAQRPGHRDLNGGGVDGANGQESRHLRPTPGRQA
jgi:hypothetical protein